MDSWITYLLQTSDSLFPTGTYAHSMGLEGLVQDGLVTDCASLREFVLHSLTPSLAHVELPLVHHAYEADVEKAVRLGHLCHALKSARELREASLRVGAQRLAMVTTLVRNPLLDALVRRSDFLSHAPVVFGFECGVVGIPARAALSAYFYQALSSQVSASMKLIRIGQNAAQQLLRDALERSEDAVDSALSIAEEEIGWFSPAVDIASARHETAYSRLFIS